MFFKAFVSIHSINIIWVPEMLWTYICLHWFSSKSKRDLKICLLLVFFGNLKCKQITFSWNEIHLGFNHENIFNRRRNSYIRPNQDSLRLKKTYQNIFYICQWMYKHNRHDLFVHVERIPWSFTWWFYILRVKRLNHF